MKYDVLCQRKVLSLQSPGGEKKREYKKEWEEGRAGERGRWQIIVKDQIEIFLFSVIRNIKDH